MSTPTPRKPLLCRLNMHHKWERRSTEDGTGYLKCTACGKDRYEVDFEHHDHGIAGGSPGRSQHQSALDIGRAGQPTG